MYPKLTLLSWWFHCSSASVLNTNRWLIALRQRCKSKQPFTKLTNEVATPSPTKLYSPFGIETPDVDKRQGAKSKRKLNLDVSKDNSKRQKTPDRTNSGESDSRTAQLKLANKKEFTNFVSPTGKFRDTVHYVEQSQRDIEAISRAIMTRPALNSSSNLNGGNWFSFSEPDSSQDNFRASSSDFVRSETKETGK